MSCGPNASDLPALGEGRQGLGVTTLQLLPRPARLGPGDVQPGAAQKLPQFSVEGALFGRIAAALQGIAVAGGRAGAPVGTSHSQSSLSIFQEHYTPVPES